MIIAIQQGRAEAVAVTGISGAALYLGCQAAGRKIGKEAVIRVTDAFPCQPTADIVDNQIDDRGLSVEGSATGTGFANLAGLSKAVGTDKAAFAAGVTARFDIRRRVCG